MAPLAPPRTQAYVNVQDGIDLWYSNSDLPYAPSRVAPLLFVIVDISICVHKEKNTEKGILKLCITWPKSCMMSLPLNSCLCPVFFWTVPSCIWSSWWCGHWCCWQTLCLSSGLSTSGPSGSLSGVCTTRSDTRGWWVARFWCFKTVLSSVRLWITPPWIHSLILDGDPRVNRFYQA